MKKGGGDSQASSKNIRKIGGTYPTYILSVATDLIRDDGWFGMLKMKTGSFPL